MWLVIRLQIAASAWHVDHITVGIVAQLPAAMIQAWRTFVPSGPQQGAM
jgi:hypothetical protein